jgi:predicted butyrate kinase (DUF1464 family)
MNFKTIIIILAFTASSVVGFGQVVASINTGANFTSYNTVNTNSQLSYAILDADTNVQFSKVNYSTTKEQLTMDAKEEIQFISLVKDGKYYLTNLPVLSQNLRVSMKNYEPGNYELHLMIKGKVVPTIMELVKK